MFGPSVRVLAGRGLVGDRYAEGEGTFSANPVGRAVTLIEAEAVAEFTRDHSCPFDPAQSRRNLLTHGKVTLRGWRLCEPCAHLTRLTSAPLLPGLVHRGGLYAQVLEDGEWTVGDAIRVDAA